MRRQRILTYAEAIREFPGRQTFGRGEELFNDAQTRDVAQGGEAFSKVSFIHPSRIIDMRDSYVTTHYLLKNCA